ncbi:hypothetical protein BGX38DRAFT_1240807 [Terfezia claveryi]|nr:hypothetical protein BGX38DRAFT_1240807 [Terfezia claveryi]
MRSHYMVGLLWIQRLYLISLTIPVRVQPWQADTTNVGSICNSICSWLHIWHIAQVFNRRIHPFSHPLMPSSSYTGVLSSFSSSEDSAWMAYTRA